MFKICLVSSKCVKQTLRRFHTRGYYTNWNAMVSEDQLTSGSTRSSPKLLLGRCTPYITSQNQLRMPKLHIKDVPQTSENSLVLLKIVKRDIKTSCLQKKPTHICQTGHFLPFSRGRSSAPFPIENSHLFPNIISVFPN